ncbi:ankyrin-3-like [Leptopilina boulardi]|uniref:ankyrin-3-like n=1 Tax=Leptopilina boulardi TaxID=63433 RepID=UPI0021F69496|nr:ankyrin-3-like [Leptopilina boulardi]
MSLKENQILEAACFSADVNKVRNLLSHNDYTDYLDSLNGYSLLQFMLKNCIFSSEKFEQLQVTHVTYMKHLSQFLKISKILLQYNIRVNEKSQDKINTPLHLAIEIENEEIVKILLSKNANVNAKNHNCDTPLHLAVRKSCKQIIQLLLANDADTKITNLYGQTPHAVTNDISMKSFLNIHELKKYFDNGGDIEEKDIDDYTALHKAVENEYYEVVEFLLSKGANINAMTELNETPLHIAAQIRNKRIVILLLEKGANINAITNTGDTPLHLAAKCLYPHDNGETLKILIKNNANLKAKNNFNLSPLNYSVNNQSSNDTKILLGDNPDRCDKNLKIIFCLSFLDYDLRAECLHRNNKDKQTKCTSELFYELDFKITIDDFDNNSIPKELYSINSNQSRCIQNLFNKESSSDENIKEFLQYQILIGAIKHGFIDIFFNLLPPFCNVNTRLDDNYTLLHYACEYGHLSIVNELLKRNANVNEIENKNKMSPLHLSVMRDSVKVTKILLEKNASIDSFNDKNETPLFLAIQENNVNCIHLLLKAGANVNSITNNNETPLLKAAINCDSTIVEMLLHYGAILDENRSIFEDLISIYIRINTIFLLYKYGASVIDLDPKLFQNTSLFIALKLESIAASSRDLSFYYQDYPKMIEYHGECRAEIEKMKLMKINETDMSIYNLLIITHRRLARYMRNNLIFDFLNSMDFEMIFPKYAKKLKTCVIRGKLEKQLIELSYNCLETIFKNQLPTIVISEILSYLDTADLHRLIIASPIDPEEKKLVQYK